mmetsp:Transcript_8133/g.19991  ORF Transcript_8133/g.19991 Transcript_8133/m.19991 type:complete len:87 (+) Transcript_8133:136-396(+)
MLLLSFLHLAYSRFFHLADSLPFSLADGSPFPLDFADSLSFGSNSRELIRLVDIYPATNTCWKCVGNGSPYRTPLNPRRGYVSCIF